MPNLSFELKLYRFGQFKIEFHSHYLMVNPENLLTQIRPTEGLLLYEENRETLRQEFRNTPYFRALADAQIHANLLQDAGITHVWTDQKGIVLTADFCPSSNPLDRSLFIELFKAWPKEQQHRSMLLLDLRQRLMKQKKTRRELAFLSS